MALGSDKHNAMFASVGNAATVVLVNSAVRVYYNYRPTDEAVQSFMAVEKGHSEDSDAAVREAMHAILVQS